MTHYSVEDLENNWEFKIVRSEYGAFRKPEVFQQLLQEEAISGWELVEKLDDRRVRFKRRKNSRRKDAGLPAGIDPYRSQYGSSSARPVLAVLVGVVIMVAVVVGVLVSLTSGEGSGGIAWAVIANAGIVILIFVLMLGAIIARRR